MHAFNDLRSQKQSVNGKRERELARKKQATLERREQAKEEKRAQRENWRAGKNAKEEKKDTSYEVEKRKLQRKVAMEIAKKERLREKNWRHRKKAWACKEVDADKRNFKKLFMR